MAILKEIFRLKIGCIYSYEIKMTYLLIYDNLLYEFLLLLCGSK